MTKKQSNKMVKKTINCPVEGMLFSKEEMSASGNGSTSAAKFSSYIHTREALGRMLMCYPMGMSLVDALELARVDFTRGRKGGAA